MKVALSIPMACSLLLSPHSQAAIQFQGIAYTSYQQGEYPETTSWKPQDFLDSQGLTAVSVSTENAYQGKGSLEIDFHLVAGHPNISKGEVYVDLRLKPPLFEPPSCSYALFDLEGQTVSLKVYVTPEMYNPDSSHPNGLQIFFKSIDGNGNWWSSYGSWVNIGISDIDNWKTVTAIPSTTTPPGGYKDPQFDPQRIVAVGVKVGTGSGSTFQGSGRFWIDNLDWPGGVMPEFGFENVESSLEALLNTDADDVSVLVTWYVDAFDSNELLRHPQKTHSDEEVIALINALHALGLNVLLKPHVDVVDGTWRGLIQPENVNLWFASYTDFIVHYAQMASDLNVGLFSVGTELESLSDSAYLSFWQDVINAVKAVYGGPLTYAANWDGFAQASLLELGGRLRAPKAADLYSVGHGFKAVSFWDLLDYVGIDAYFPLSDAQDPSLAAIMAGWTSYTDGAATTHDWVQDIETFASTVGKPVIFTEIGYASRDFATHEPWTEGDPAKGDLPNAALQARAYEAAFRVFQGKPWFRGFFWWNWLQWSDAGGLCNLSFTPQNKPAEETLLLFYDNGIFSDGFESGDTSAWSL